jgi:hypothetical protein
MRDKTGRQLNNNEIMQKGFGRLGAILKEFDVYLLHLIGSIPSHLVRRLFYRIAGI